MKRFLTLALIAWALLAMPAITHASDVDFSKGVQALEAKKYKRAYRIFLNLSEKDHAGAKLQLGRMYYYGLGVSKNHNRAFRLYHSAAEQGDARGQNDVGTMYAEGAGVRQNYKEAISWYAKAAEQGLATAQNNLSFSYANGEGIPKNNFYAYMWAHIASTNGDENTRETSNFLLNKIGRNLRKLEIQNAQTLAKRCFESYYRDCEW